MALSLSDRDSQGVIAAGGQRYGFVFPGIEKHIGNFRFYRIIVALAVNLILSGLTQLL